MPYLNSEPKDESFYHSTRPIPGFTGYRIDCGGNVYSCLTNRGDISFLWKPIKSQLKHGGYLQVGLIERRGKVVWRSVARLVLLSWIGPCPPNQQCCHNDGNKLNNCVVNLRWDTQVGNYADRIKHGTSSFGIHRKRKLTVQDVVEIRNLRKSGETMPAIAKRFGLDKSTVRSIVIKEYWPYVNDDGTISI